VSIRYSPREAQVWMYEANQTPDGVEERWSWSCGCDDEGSGLESMEDACRRLHLHAIEKHPADLEDG
jgi:hypothetical protein